MLRVNDRVSIPDSELEVSFARSGGAGGQNVNKVNSKAQLRWRFSSSAALSEGARRRFLARHGNRVTAEGDVLVTSERHRDQAQNVADCEDKLRRMILEVLEPPRRRVATKPTRSSRERRLKEKARRAQAKQGRGRVRSDD